MSGGSLHASDPVRLPANMPRPTMSGDALVRHQQRASSRSSSFNGSPSGSDDGVWFPEENLLAPPIFDPEEEKAANPMFPSPYNFNLMVTDYLRNLSDKKREKALLTQKMYDSVMQVLHDPKNTGTKTAQFRFWAKKMFALTNFGGENVICHDNKPVAVREQIYEVLVHCHGQATHGGRDKTSAQVRKYYSWIPKEIIARFVRDCPFCASRRTQSGANMPMSDSQAFLISLQSSDTQNTGKRSVSLAEARADAIRHGHKPYRKTNPRPILGTDGLPVKVNNGNSAPISIERPTHRQVNQSDIGPHGRIRHHQQQHDLRATSDDYIHYNDGPIDPMLVDLSNWPDQPFLMRTQSLGQEMTYPSTDPYALAASSATHYGYTSQFAGYQNLEVALPRRASSYEETSHQEQGLGLHFPSEQDLYRRLSEPATHVETYNAGVGIYDNLPLSSYVPGPSTTIYMEPIIPVITTSSGEYDLQQYTGDLGYSQINDQHKAFVKVESPLGQSQSPGFVDNQSFPNMSLLNGSTAGNTPECGASASHESDHLANPTLMSRSNSGTEEPLYFDVNHPGPYPLLDSIHGQDLGDLASTMVTQSFELSNVGPPDHVVGSTYDSSVYNGSYLLNYGQVSDTLQQQMTSPTHIKTERFDESQYVADGNTSNTDWTLVPVAQATGVRSRQSTVNDCPSEPAGTFWNNQKGQSYPQLA